MSNLIAYDSFLADHVLKPKWVLVLFFLIVGSQKPHITHILVDKICTILPTNFCVKGSVFYIPHTENAMIPSIYIQRWEDGGGNHSTENTKFGWILRSGSRFKMNSYYSKHEW